MLRSFFFSFSDSFISSLVVPRPPCQCGQTCSCTISLHRWTCSRYDFVWCLVLHALTSIVQYHRQPTRSTEISDSSCFAENHHIRCAGLYRLCTVPLPEYYYIRWGSREIYETSVRLVVKMVHHTSLHLFLCELRCAEIGEKNLRRYCCRSSDRVGRKNAIIFFVSEYLVAVDKWTGLWSISIAETITFPLSRIEKNAISVRERRNDFQSQWRARLHSK